MTVRMLSPDARESFDVETGLFTRKALDTYVRLAGRCRQPLTVVALTWKGESAPTSQQVRVVADALCTCQDDAALAARVSENQFAVATMVDATVAQTLMRRLRQLLEGHLPVSVSFTGGAPASPALH